MASLWLILCSRCYTQWQNILETYDQGTFRCVTGPCGICNVWLHQCGTFLYKELRHLHILDSSFSNFECQITEAVKFFVPMKKNHTPFSFVFVALHIF